MTFFERFRLLLQEGSKFLNVMISDFHVQCVRVIKRKVHVFWSILCRRTGICTRSCRRCLFIQRTDDIVLPIPFATIHLSDKSSLDEVKADFSGFVPIIRRKSPKTIVTTGTLIGILLSCACRSEIFLGFRQTIHGGEFKQDIEVISPILCIN